MWNKYIHASLPPGQFWNIPVTVSEYEGQTNVPGLSNEDYYTVTISHPLSKPRSFTGHLYDFTWEFESKKCLYVGNPQGGPLDNLDDPNDSVIEGVYYQYLTQGPFKTDYYYAVFDDEKCSF